MTTALGAVRREVKPMIALAVPVVVAELGWIAMGIVDIGMVGRLGAEAIGAVGVGSMLFLTLAVFGIGFLLGLDTLVELAELHVVTDQQRPPCAELLPRPTKTGSAGLGQGNLRAPVPEGRFDNDAGLPRRPTSS